MDGSEARIRRFGRYRAGRLIGYGGMGVVYEGRSDDGELVAIKIIQGPVTPNLGRRFTREGELIARIRHPNVVKVSDFGTNMDGNYIVMELLEGEPLSRVLAREGRFPLTRIIDVFVPILSAVSAIHRATVIHRDLKLANVMLARRELSRDEPVLLDFGISKSFEASASEDTALTRTHALLGTLAYLSPEQTLNARAVSVLSDQYALGVMLYELATGRRPFQGSSQYEMMHAILHQPVVPPSELAPELPPAMDALILRAMNRDAAARYPSVRALARDLLVLAEPRVRDRWLLEFAEVPAVADVAEVTVVDERSRPVVRERARSNRRVRSAVGVIVVALGTIAMTRQSSRTVPERTRTSAPVSMASAVQPSSATSAPPPAISDVPAKTPREGAELAVRAVPDLSASASSNGPVASKRSLHRRAGRATPTVAVSSALPRTLERAPDEDDAIDPFASRTE